MTLTSCVIFSFQAKEPHVFLPQPASTVPDAVSVPVANDVVKLERVTSVPYSILEEPKVNEDMTPVKG